MDLEALIQETAKKVVSNLQQNPSTTQQRAETSCSASSVSGGILIVLDGAGEGLEHALNQIKTIRSAGLSGQVVISRNTDPNLQIEGFDIIPPRSVVEKVQDCVIFVPYLSVGLAGKLANLVEDEAAARVLVRGLIDQHKIFVGINELDILIGGKKRLTFGLSQRLKEYQRLLKAYDLVMIKDINQVLKACDCTAPTKPISGGDKTGVSQSAQCNVGTTGCEGCGQCVVLNKTGVENLIESGADRVSAAVGVNQVDGKVAGMIDHTALKPNTSEEDIRKLCSEAKKYHFASVCVNPAYVALASDLLKGSGVKVCTVIGFPLGATTSTTKAMETRDAIANGAAEIDMVINVGALKSGNNALVKKDIEAVVEAARGRAIVKVILETSLLTDEEKVRASLLSKYAGADFVKTATGFGPGGATVEDIALMRKTVGSDMGVKASGGIRDLKTAQAMIEAGASRIGASASVAIVKGTENSGKGY